MASEKDKQADKAELGGLGVVGGGLIRGGVEGQPPEFQQGPGMAGQYRFPLAVIAL